MLRRFLSAIIAALMIAFANFVPVSAQTPTMNELQRAAKIKSRVSKLGSGPKVKVIVELEDGETIKGYVSSIADDSFVVEEDSGPADIPYLQVKAIRKKPSTGLIVATAAGATVGLIYLAGFLLSKCSPCIGP